MSDSLKTVCCPNILIQQVTVYIISLFIILTQQIVISMHIKYFWWLYKIFSWFPMSTNKENQEEGYCKVWSSSDVDMRMIALLTDKFSAFVADH